MTFVSVAQATRSLGIDAKTLHRWLAEAHFPLQSHPVDGRKKGMSQEQLHQLSRLHHRHLASSEEEALARLSSQPTTLPADLFSLPEQFCALQTQIAALQQQVADLTHLLTQPRPEPAIPAAPSKPASTLKRPAKSTAPAPRSRPATKPPHKSVPVIPRVEYGEEGHYVVTCPKHGVLPFEPDTPQWFAWVRAQSSFRFVGKGGHFTAHHEGRVLRGAWRAHRHIRNHSYTLRLAKSQELTMAVLEQAAKALQAHLT